jgi:tRNA-binding EMAP/Myf-like protein
MKGEKQSKIDQIQIKVNNIEQALANVTKEVMQNRDLIVGCINVIKKMPDYDKALEAVKVEVEKIKKERQEKENVE